MTSGPGSASLKSGGNNPHFLLMRAEPMDGGRSGRGQQELCKWPPLADGGAGTRLEPPSALLRKGRKVAPSPRASREVPASRALAPAGTESRGEGGEGENPRGLTRSRTSGPWGWKGGATEGGSAQGGRAGGLGLPGRREKGKDDPFGSCLGFCPRVEWWPPKR